MSLVISTADRVPFISANWPGLRLCAFPFLVFAVPLGDFSATERRNKMKLIKTSHVARILTLIPAARDAGTLWGSGHRGGCGLHPDPHPQLCKASAPHQRWPSPSQGPMGLSVPSSSPPQPPSPSSRCLVASPAKEAAMPGAWGRCHPGWGRCWGQPMGGTWTCSALLPVSAGSM